MNNVIRIEICKSFIEWKYNLRIGDLSGSNEYSNILKSEVIDFIEDEIRELK